jgi:hypothetical protein
LPRINLPTARPAAPAPATWHQPAAAPTTPVNAALAIRQQPRPKIRALAPDAPPLKAAALVLPSPEALGLAAPAATVSSGLPAEMDWNELRLRLKQLGAVGFHLDQVAGGNWRATLLLPGAIAATTRHVEALAETEAAAVAGVLARATR